MLQRDRCFRSAHADLCVPQRQFVLSADRLVLFGRLVLDTDSPAQTDLFVLSARRVCETHGDSSSEHSRHKEACAMTGRTRTALKEFRIRG